MKDGQASVFSFGEDGNIFAVLGFNKSWNLSPLKQPVGAKYCEKELVKPLETVGSTISYALPKSHIGPKYIHRKYL